MSSQKAVHTYRGHGADLSYVLLVAQRAGGTTRGPPAVPEGVVILQGVLTCTWTHRLQVTKHTSQLLTNQVLTV